ncbi:MAG: PIN domain-containing protein [Candidatus Lokiarchaeota archaeon]|nr:PIN domain-containing protein [Candidatus Lokiarchaeota archaeon]MBD3340174.1 PIN domain-containing protein [Candidatus Lokiarchaeota archaeon]
MDKKVVDLNFLSIYFVNNHPGYEYIKEIMDDGLSGSFKLIIPDYLPFRAYWILTTKWKIEKEIAKELIFDFVNNYSSPDYKGLEREYIIQTFKYSNDLKHDIYDCSYLALAIQEGASFILTTDTDFKTLCVKMGLTYENPVPMNVLKKFYGF